MIEVGAHFIQEPIGKSQKEFEMQHLRKLQWEFNARLNLDYQPQDLLNRSFNPVTDRWHVETLRRRGDVEGLKGFRDEMRENHRTDLMERFHAAESYGEFLIKDENLYSPEFPEMPFGEVLKRGAEYRKGLGSSEPEREGDLGEVGGWDAINKALVSKDTPVGTTYISLSPPSMVEDGAYKGKFVDSYTLAINEKKNRYIKRSRIAVSWDNNEYKKAALSLDPNFLKDYDGRPMDAWFLSHPIKADKELSPISGDGLSKQDFQFIYGDKMTQRLIGHYENLIFAEKVDWLEVALAVNSIRNYTDELKRSLHDESSKQMAANTENELDGIAFQAYIYKKGMQKVQTVGGGGCPANKGINMNGLFGGSGMNTGIDIFSNSVAKFLNNEQEWFSCPKCGYKADGPVGNTCPGCQLTLEQYKEMAEEEGVVVCA